MELSLQLIFLESRQNQPLIYRQIILTAIYTTDVMTIMTPLNQCSHFELQSIRRTLLFGMLKLN